MKQQKHLQAESAKSWLALADFSALAVSFGIAMLLLWLFRYNRISASFELWWAWEGRQQGLAFLGLSLITVINFWWRGHYSLRLPFWDELLEVLRALLLAALLNGMLVLLGKFTVSRFLWPVSWGMALLLLPYFRSMMRDILLKKHIWQLPTVIIGAGVNAVEACRAMYSERQLGFEVQAFLSVDQDAPAQLLINGETLPVVRLAREELLAWLTANGRPHVVIAVNEDELRQLENQIEQLSLRYKDLHIIPPIAGLPLFGVVPHHFFSHEVLLLRVRNNLLVKPLIWLKRAFDLFGAIGGLLLLSPLLVYVMWRIKQEGGPGAIFFGHVRVGMNGVPFKCWKFRTMVHNSQEVLDRLLANDSGMEYRF